MWETLWEFSTGLAFIQIFITWAPTVMSLPRGAKLSTYNINPPPFLFLLHSHQGLFLPIPSTSLLLNLPLVDRWSIHWEYNANWLQSIIADIELRKRMGFHKVCENEVEELLASCAMALTNANWGVLESLTAEEEKTARTRHQEDFERDWFKYQRNMRGSWENW